MLPFEDRYTRQRQLPEVGPAGQERIFALRVQVSGDPAGSVARQYLLRAGVSQVTVSEAPPGHFAHARFFRYQVAREFADGSHRALDALRTCLSTGLTNEGRRGR